MRTSREREPARGWLANQLRAFATALTFLTRLPSPRHLAYESADLAQSPMYFPVVGLVVGLAAGRVFAASTLFWSPLVAAGLSTAATVWLTGALHEDALADSFDGFGGGWSAEQVLSIMKDSRVGSYGVVGLLLVLVVKIGALTSVASVGRAGSNSLVARALVAGHVLGRWSSLPLIASYSYVRPTESRSRHFTAGVTTRRLLVGSALALVVVVPTLLPFGILRMTFALAASCVVTAVAGRYFARRIGGITGDCLGAANQLVELVIYLVVAVGSGSARLR